MRLLHHVFTTSEHLLMLSFNATIGLQTVCFGRGPHVIHGVHVYVGPQATACHSTPYFLCAKL